MREKQLFLAGTWVDGSAGLLDVASPFTRETTSRVAMADVDQLEQAIGSAVEVASHMAALSGERRTMILTIARDRISRRKQELSAVLVEEAGKPLSLARAEVDRAMDTFTAAAIMGRNPPLAAQDLTGFGTGARSLGLIRRVPIGPILAITPFNFPLNLVAHKLAPAILAGCPVVLKPSSQAPTAALLLAEILADAGLPPGGLSVLPCRSVVAESVVEDPRIKLLTFTGSATVGWGLKRMAWKKRVVLELGGNAAVVVEPDAEDLPGLARRIAVGANAFAGQSCISVQRVFVHRAIHPEFRKLLIEETERIPFGDPANLDTITGPLIDPGNAHRVEQWIEQAVAAGGQRLTGGPRIQQVIRPTLLEDVPAEQPVVADEAFGPVATLFAYDRFEEALDRVNDSRFGLQAGVVTRDIAKVRQAWEVLDVGAVIQGDIPSWRCDQMPYGGVKDSGIGREGPASAYLELTEERLLVLRGAGGGSK